MNLMSDKPHFIPTHRRKFNLIFEFEEGVSEDEIHRTVANILYTKGIKWMSWDYPEQCKNKILISIMDHLDTLKKEEF